MSLQAQESQTSSEIQAISARIAFLQKLNKLTYDTTLFTRKLRWLLRRSLSEKPTVAEVVELMNKELELSQAQAAVAVEGVADELKLEVKQGIIALKAGLAFIEDNYKAGSDPEADAIIAKIKANISALEARFGKKPSGSETGTEPPVEAASTASPVEPPPAEQSTTEAPPVEQSTAESPPAEASTAEAPPAEVSSTASEAPATLSTGGGSLIGSETASSEASTTEAPATEVPTGGTSPAETSTAAAAPVEAPTAETPVVTVEGTGVHNATNDTSSTGEAPLAESPISATAPATFF